MTDDTIPFDKKDGSKAEPDKLEDLAAHLTEALEPRAPIMSPHKRALTWVAFSIAYFAALIFLFSMPFRSTVMHDSMHSSLGVDIVLSIAMSASAIFAAMRLMVPVEEGRLKRIVILPSVIFALFTAWSVGRIGYDIMAGDFLEHLHFHPCFWEGFGLVAAPIAALIYFARKGASTHPYWLHAMGMISIFGFGWVGLRLTCGIDHAGHAFLFHFLPYIVLGVVSGLFSRKLFRTI